MRVPSYVFIVIVFLLQRGNEGSGIQSREHNGKDRFPLLVWDGCSGPLAESLVQGKLGLAWLATNTKGWIDLSATLRKGKCHIYIWCLILWDCLSNISVNII